MRTALLMYAADYFQGGLWRYAYNLGKNLVVLDDKNTYEFFHGQKKEENFLSLNQYEKIEPQTVIGKIFKQPQLLAKEGFDIVHQTENFCPLFSSKQKYKKIITIHDLTPLKFPQHFSRSSWWYYKYFLPQLLKRVDNIIVPSFSTKEDLVNLYKIKENKITVIYEGIEDKFFEPISDDIKTNVLKKFKIDKPYVLTLGVNFHRNLPTIFRAYKGLSQKMQETVSLVVAGATGKEYIQRPKFIGRAIGYIEKEVEKFGLSDKVIFTGYMSDIELRSLYQKAEVFCFASIAEGFGFPPLEAMASNCLVISSNRSAMQETLKQGAILLDPLDYRAWTENLESVLTNPKKFKVNLETSYKTAQSFKWEKCAREHLKIYYA